ncbi:MAG: AAA domain-containing protein [Bacteroides sp.]|nr:AAA domain-containing protein [Bacteroides sp.]
MAHLDQPLQLIYYGAPGTGKSFTIDKATDEKNSVRTTFHPDSDYAGFVGAYKPTMECVPMSVFVGKEVHLAQPQGEHPGTERKIVYKYVPQAFLKAYVEAWKRYSEDEDNPYYLVIEEINRGNCAQIFGDLFQLLDRNNVGSSSYAISADEDIAQFLREDRNGFAGFSEEQKDIIRRFVLKKDSGSEEHIGDLILNGSKLLLPPNMRIWATMNTSDQSLFPIDSAFKRRWNWEYMPIEYDKKNWKFSIGGKRYSWGTFLEYINPKIYELTQSEDKQMGYFFAKPDKKSRENLQENDTISAKVFVNKVLFYLWTDVFKDYDLTQAPFVYEDKDDNNKKKAYRFTDFFPIDNSEKLIDFVEGMGFPEAEDDELDFTPDNEGGTYSKSSGGPIESIRIGNSLNIEANGKNAINFFIDFLKLVGLEKLSEFKELKRGSFQVVVGSDVNPNPKYYRRSEIVDGKRYFIHSYNGNEEKRNFIKKIAEKYYPNEDITILPDEAAD